MSTLTPATATAAPAAPLLNEVICERFIKALDVKRRLHVMRAFVDELDRVTQRKPFSIRNDIVWHAMLDVRDKLVIDLYSLSVEMRHGIEPPTGGVSKKFLKKRGLFVEIRDHYLASLTRTYVQQPDDDEYEVEQHTESKAECFARLFPSCNTDSPSAADVEDLCERFRLRMDPLREDRNKNRAHALEGETNLALMHKVPELEALFEYVEELLEDLSMASSLSVLGRTNLNNADCKETAADLVDLVLLESISEVRRLTTTANRSRAELYARLHEVHDAAVATETGVKRELHFNDRQFGPPFVDGRVRRGRAAT